MTFGERLHAATRTRKPIVSDREIAQRIGITLAEWNDILGAPARNKDGAPTIYPLEMLNRIAYATKIQKDDLFEMYAEALDEAMECEQGEDPKAFVE